MPSTVGIVASGVVFSPLDLLPALWLDAADTTTITESGGSVSQWDDKSGNGRNFTQGSGTAQPTTGTRTLNGLNVVDFDGTTDVMGAGDTLDLLTNNLTVVVVGLHDTVSSTAGRTIIGKYRASPSAGSWLVLNEENNMRSLYSRANNTNVIAGASYTNTTDPFCVTMTLNRGAGTLEQRINGSAAGSNTFTPDSATSFNNTSSLWMGALRNFADNGFLANYWFNGYIAEVIVVLGVLTADQITDTAAYLSGKWGVTL